MADLTESDFIAFMEQAMRDKAEWPHLFSIEGLGLVWGRYEADGSITLREVPDRRLTQSPQPAEPAGPAEDDPHHQALPGEGRG